MNAPWRHLAIMTPFAIALAMAASASSALVGTDPAVAYEPIAVVGHFGQRSLRHKPAGRPEIGHQAAIGASQVTVIATRGAPRLEVTPHAVGHGRMAQA